MTERALEEFQLGARGLEFVKAELGDAKALGAALLEIVDDGEVLTLAPIGTSLDRLYAFAAGALLSENTDMSRAFPLEGGGKMMAVVSLLDERLALIRKAMLATPGSCCIADDVNPTCSDHRERAEPCAFGVGDEVYNLASPGASLDQIEDIFAGILPWHGVTAVCGETPGLNSEREVTVEALRRAALSATLITCSAYDGEGFVAWRRKG